MTWGLSMAGDEQIKWHRNGRCESSACVEVGRGGDRVVVRDSADPEGPVLSFDSQEWAAFVAWLKRGSGR
ncbi:MAG TPA: DUF397 domain-containing protein [Micromonosporaceae bacterium]|nr:DUF397 domain-containing protein [Micromonosporaceae bacterium]